MDQPSPSAVLLVGSHILRSIVSWSQKDTLETEIGALRIEVHRARELVSGFTSVLEECERSNYWLRFVNQFVVGLGLALTFLGLVIFLLVRTYRAGVSSSVKVEVAETRAIEGVNTGGPRAGPLRPSDRRAREDRA